MRLPRHLAENKLAMEAGEQNHPHLCGRLFFTIEVALFSFFCSQVALSCQLPRCWDESPEVAEKNEGVRKDSPFHSCHKAHRSERLAIYLTFSPSSCLRREAPTNHKPPYSLSWTSDTHSTEPLPASPIPEPFRDGAVYKFN